MFGKKDLIKINSVRVRIPSMNEPRYSAMRNYLNESFSKIMDKDVTLYQMALY